MKRTYLPIALCLATCILGGAWTALGRGQQPGTEKAPLKPVQDKAAGAALTRYLVPATECARCHTAPLPTEPVPVLCRCTEATIWLKEDKHRDAYKALGDQRSREMGQLLGIDPVKEPACLSCHAMDVRGARTHPRFTLEEGVTCVACHGAAKEWIDKHGGVDREEWRKMDRSVKEQTYGMIDLWDPVRRTKLCASCHVGNREEGKFVTHAMYAAGHPPLPSFEVGAFSDAMPRHWEYPSEKSPEAQKLLQFNPKEREQATLVATGGIVVFGERMRLLAADARKVAAEGGILDFSHFDCAACHHDLRSPSWRQQRGYVGIPGRPRGPEWPLELVALDGGPSGDLQAQLTALAQAFDAKPFGEAARIATVAGKLSDWANVEAARVAPLEDAGALRLLRNLTTLKKGHIPDFDAARQRAWAVQAIHSYYSRLGERSLGKSPVPTEPLLSLTAALGLDLPSGQKRSILGELDSQLQTRGNYDPARFLRLMDQLRMGLPGDK